MQALPTQPAPLDWPPFILNISTHPVRQSLLPEHVKPPAIVEAAMLLPLNTSHTKPTDLPLAGRKMQMNVTPFAVMLAIMGTILVAAMLRVAVIQQHCTLWPPRAPKNRLKAASTTPSREDSSTYQVRTYIMDTSSRLCHGCDMILQLAHHDAHHHMHDDVAAACMCLGTLPGCRSDLSMPLTQTVQS